MKRILIAMNRLFFLLAILLVASVAGAGDFITFPNFPTRGQGPFDKNPWWYSGLTFYAPFDNPSDPLRLIKGTGTLSFTRATTATYVHPTTGLITSAASGQLRIEANGALIEGQRTNLLKQSENFGTTWANGRTSEAIDNTTAPDGTLTADRITVDNTASNTHYIYQGGITSIDNNATATYSGYLKDGNSTWATLTITTKAGSYRHAWFNIATGVVGSVTPASGITSDIQSVGNGWYRCRMTLPDVGAGTAADAVIFIAEADGDITYDGDNARHIYVWGAQLEAASFPSSYIPTVAAAVTRNASVLTEQTASNIDNVDGTIALQWTPRYASTVAVGTAVLFDAGGVKATYTSADRKINFTDGTNTVSSTALTFSANVAQKLAFRWGPSGLLVYRDGSQAATGATYTAPMLNANLYIGTDTSSANAAYSNFKPVRTWNREFSATEMGGITQ